VTHARALRRYGRWCDRGTDGHGRGTAP
jgi:hypothetical protein